VHDVKIKYRPIPWIPYNITIPGKHPSSWNELSTLQFITVVDFLSKPFTVENQVVLVNSLLNLKSPLQSFPPEILVLHDFVKLTTPLSDWVIKKLIIDKQVFIGPSNQFRNVSIGEFAFADSNFLKFLKTKDESFLFKMIACLYRPENHYPNPNQTVKDLRMKFNPVYVDENSLFFSKLDQDTKLALLFNYKNIRTWIQNKYPYVFPKEKSERKEGNSSEGWRDFIRSLVAGNYTLQDEILKTLLHTVLYDMNHTIKVQIKSKP
jgi:hypothetical protein